ncbi:DUF1499 domain-containing protein [Psychromarinibacter sp. C21-152]|uniref:DUF1499 domain-containing protein n=1 Tax=Psychromarinibacter sediminicola TaxID=3033385 RepID=A0AAE3T8N1_9RHOB|nr:DUF1499 domain-containing protein [Psychromarinibacter sediminicola]MDF0600893.1 DUF1499 domain-containing protein [Psychromarinibacter sediminicola]
MKLLLLLLALAALMLLAWVRLAPSDPDDWHVDPLKAGDPGRGGVLLLPGEEARTYKATPKSLLSAFDRVAMEAPRVEQLAGSVGSGRITYIARTKWLGFPDYITVTAVPAEGGAQLAVYSRLRYGRGDMGVNRKRLDRWLEELQTVVE